MKIIGISGKMHSGKSWVSDRLQSRVPGLRRLSFAAPLKRDIIEMGFPQEDVTNKPPYMRRFMQEYGQARRAVDPDYWVTRLQHDIITSLREEQLPTLFGEDERLFVIDDMRFENEADMLRNLTQRGVRVFLLRLKRKNYDRSNIDGADDISETALDDYPEFDLTASIPSGDLDGLFDVARALEDWING